MAKHNYSFQTKTLSFALNYFANNNKANFLRILKNLGVCCSEDTFYGCWMKGKIGCKTVDALSNAFHIPLPFWYNPLFSQYICKDSVINNHWVDCKTDVTLFVKDFYIQQHGNFEKTYKMLNISKATLMSHLYGNPNDPKPRLDYNRFISWFELVDLEWEYYSHNDNYLFISKSGNADNNADTAVAKASEDEYEEYSKSALIQMLLKNEEKSRNMEQCMDELNDANKLQSAEIAKLKLELNKQEKKISEFSKNQGKKSGKKTNK